MDSAQLMDTDTQVNKRLLESWAWIPAEIRKKFTPTSVVSILVVAFGCGSAVASYRSKFHEADRARREDHSVLIEQTRAVNSIANQLAHLDGTLQGLDRRLSLQEEWQQKVTGVAETVAVPKLGHRARKP
jgi:hypothetical protein